MSDNESSDNKVKPTIFYATKSPEEEPKRTQGRRDGDRPRSSDRGNYGKSDKPRSDRSRSDSRRSNDSRGSYGKPSSDKPRSDSGRSKDSWGSYGKSSSDKPRSDRPRSDSERSSDSRIESFGRTSYAKSTSDKPRSDRPRADNNYRSDRNGETFKPRHKKEVSEQSSSPWKKRFQNTEQLPTFDSENQSSIDHEQIKRRRKEETLVYSENSCKAVFDNRPEAIVKAFLLQDKTYEFKALVAYLVEHRLGYDVITDEQMTKIAQTPHHGGICLIVKKRQPQLVGDYLSKSAQLEQDCILAVDDINNPHNLGGIVRTAAFFGVNGILLRQPDSLENGAALRVSEGGAEAIVPIKADDLLVSVDQFKQQGYQIVALLPCKVNSIKTEMFTKTKMNAKVVFIIFQQINAKLAEFADKVVYLPGSESMSALNISVLTGIMLAKWQEGKNKV